MNAMIVNALMCFAPDWAKTEITKIQEIDRQRQQLTAEMNGRSRDLFERAQSVARERNGGKSVVDKYEPIPVAR